ncbi:MAG: immunoglobulin domain-containing protein [Verrucomicrobiota bacterium]
MINLKTNILKSLLMAGILAGAANLLPAQTTTNLLDTFNRAGTLNGSSPVIGDTNLVSTNWVCNTTYTTTNVGGGGMVIRAGGTGTTAYIPLLVTNGYVYTISVTQNISASVGSGDRWGTVGFDNGSGTTAIFSTKGPWMLMKATGHMEAYYNGLTSIYAGDNAGYGAGTNNQLQIVLDTTTPTAWTTAFKVNGIQKATKTLPSGFTANRVTFFAYGTIALTNSGFTVTSIKPTAPSMTLQPAGFTNWAGVNGSLTTAASGAQPLSYQWYLGSTSSPLNTQTNSTLNFTPLAGTNSGSYFVVITNYLGSVTSSVAAVHVETNSVMTLTPSISVGAIPASGSDAASGISSTNIYLDALNFTTSGTLLDINGVTFSPVSVTGTAAISGVDSVNGGSWALSKTTVQNTSFHTATLAAGLSDGSLSTLLSDAAQLTGSVQIGDSITLTFSNLLVTGQYRIRLFYAPLSTNSLPVIATFNGRGTNEVVNLDENLGASINSSGAYYVDYSFTAPTNFASATLATGVAGTGAVLAGAALQQVSAPLVAPAIAAQPVGFTNWMTYSNALAVSASGSVPLHYQWYQGGLPLDGQTNNLLVLSSLDATNVGTYEVIVTNVVGSVTSSIANVVVITNGVWGLTPSISVVQIPASGSDTSAGIDPTNLYLTALDFGSDTTPLSVNGVNFTQISVTGNGTGTGTLPVFSGSDTNYGGRWSLTASNSATDQSGLGSVASGGATVQADGSLATLLTDMSYLRGGIPAGNYAKLSLSGLAPGAQYAFHYYYRQWSANDTPHRPIVFTFDGQGTNEVALVDLDGGGANYINYQFAAVSTNLDVTMTAVNAGNGPHIYGVTLQQTAPAPIPPSIAAQPAGFTNWLSYSGSMTVSVNGSLPFGYQWYQNGSPILDQTNATLSFASLADTDAGAYKVIVSNLSGSVTSSVVNVSVITNGVWTLTPSLSVIQIPASGSDAASGIDSTNTYVAALDFGSDTTALSINGVNFMQISINGAGSGTGTLPVFSGADTNYGGTWSITASNSATDGSGFNSLASGGSAIASQADGSLSSLLTDLIYLPGTQPIGDYAKLTLGGLTPGAQYAFRYYYRQWGSSRPIDFSFDGQGTNETVRVDLDAGGANYINYQFTAASSSLDVTMTTDLRNNGPHIYGVTLQQTAPAPGPTLASVTPNPVKGSSLPVTLSLTGSGFDPACSVTLTNPALTGTAYTPATRNGSTNVLVSVVLGTTAGAWTATVVNPGAVASVPVGFTVSVPSPVQINQTSIKSAGGAKIVLNGTGGTAGYSYVVASATNLNPPVAWWPVVTNTFDGSGNFTYTNAVDTGTAQLFLRIQQ